MSILGLQNFETLGMSLIHIFWHIVNRYDTLAPRTVFVMGSAVSREDRRPILKTCFQSWTRMINLSLMYHAMMLKI
jgi:hypothetical protein